MLKQFPKIIVLSAVLTVILSTIAAAAGDYLLELHRVENYPNIGDFFTADFDGDGNEELFRLFSDRHAFQVNKFSREILLAPALYQGNYVEDIGFAGAGELDSIPGSEILLALRTGYGDSAWIEVVSGRDKSLTLCRTEAVFGKNISDRNKQNIPGWDGGFTYVQAVDLDDDGVKELVATMIVSFDLYPRGIFVYEYPSGKLKWRFLTAGIPQNLSIGDADGNGKREIYFKTWACSNGAVQGDRSDTTAYAFALDYDGSVRWRQDLYDRFDFSTTNVQLCDCDDDGVLEIYYAVLARSENFDSHVCSLEKHRASDNDFIKLRSFDANDFFRQVFIADLDNDGITELLLDHIPAVISPIDFSIINQGGIKGANIETLGDIDGDPDNGLEIILRKKDSLYIVNRQLEPLAAYGTKGGEYILWARIFASPFGGRYLGILTGVGDPNKAESNLYIFKVEPSIFAGIMGRILKFQDGFWFWVPLSFAFGLLCALVMSRYWRARKGTVSAAGARYDDLQVALTAFGHGQTAARTLNRLLFLYSNIPGDKVQLEEIQPNVQAAIESFHSFTFEQLTNLAVRAGRIKKLAAAARSVKRGAEDLNNFLKRNPAHMIKPEAVDEICSYVEKTVEKIIAAVDLIRKDVRHHFTCDPLAVVAQVLHAVDSEMSQKGIAVGLKMTASGPRRPVFFDQNELAVILEELAVNAGRAVEDSEVKRVDISYEFLENELLVRFADTGCGLNGTEEERIFDREFSTKEGEGGYGLYHAKQQVEKFGGRIRIRNNKPGPGVTVELKLKTVKND